MQSKEPETSGQELGTKGLRGSVLGTVVKPRSDSLTPGQTYSRTVSYQVAFPTRSKYPWEPATHLGSQGSGKSLVMRSVAVCPAMLSAWAKQLPAGGGPGVQEEGAGLLSLNHHRE